VKRYLHERLAYGTFTGVLCFLTCGCFAARPQAPSSIEFTQLPPAGEGSPVDFHEIAGRVKGAERRQRLVLFARSGVWWVQPTAEEPFTEVRPDGSWKTKTHPGSAYAALLVTANYKPPTTINTLPEKGGSILAVAQVEGPALTHPVIETLDFSGYQWERRQAASDRGGSRNRYDPANVWTDKDGFLHLKIAKRGQEWTSAEVSLLRSLGYGSYRFVVHDIAGLEPAAVFSVFTWDDAGPPREVDIELSRWGETTSKNMQYVVQPYYVPANVVRFVAPEGLLTHSFEWEAGRIAFKTFRGTETTARPVAQHTFTSGVPATGAELVHMNLYVYDNKSNPLRNEAEVIIEKFEFLP
jgi:hypothetical protein